MQLQACSLSLSLISLLLSALSISAADSVIYVQCSQLHFTSKTPYESNLNSLFTSLVESASLSNFNTFTISPTGNSPNDVVYGLFQCQGDLSVSDCRDCVAKSLSPLKTTCPVSIGGTIQSEGCLVKYDNTSFFGVEDKTEVLKRCGPSIGDHNSDILNSRNDALGYLNNAPNGEYFRMGESGSVQGVAQCVQDLSVTDCQDCLAEASGKLRSECETSSRGEMYLGKCYIRYADHRIDDDNQNNTSNSSNNGNRDGNNSNNNTLKAFGIIFAAFVSAGGLSYFFSDSLTKNVLKFYAQNTNNNNNNNTNKNTNENKNENENTNSNTIRNTNIHNASQEIKILIETAKDSVSTLKKTAKESADTLKKTTKESADTMKERTKESIDKLKEATENATKSVADTASSYMASLRDRSNGR